MPKRFFYQQSCLIEYAAIRGFELEPFDLASSNQMMQPAEALPERLLAKVFMEPVIDTFYINFYSFVFKYSTERETFNC